MNFELISSLARLRRDALLDEAALRRRLRDQRRLGRPVRIRIARALRAVGYAAVSLGDALAQTR